MSKEAPDAPLEPDPSANRRVTLRDIARELGVSHVTVSKALRNQSGASEELKIRIRKKAEEMGYVPDPMLTSLSYYRKTSKKKPVQAELAWINTWSQPKRLHEYREFDLYWEGAVYSAQRFGYQLVEFTLAEIPLRRLENILKARNIQGILLPPLPLTDDLQGGLDRFNWSGFAVVRFGHVPPYPKTHCVTSAQMMNTMLIFERALDLGYNRIGFACEYWLQRLFGVGYYWAQETLPAAQRLPPLLLNRAHGFKHQQDELGTWLQQTGPDAVLTDMGELPEMVKNLGYRIPEDIGLATTSIHDTPIDAGIDQQPYEIGRAAIRILTALMAERSFGIPDCRNETLIEGKWVDGSMLPPRN